MPAPSTFPVYAILLDHTSYKKTRAKAVIRTAMDDGMVKQQRVRSRVLVQRELKYGFKTKADYQSFITWFQDSTNYGADWFSWTDPEDAVVKLARIVEQLDSEQPDDPILTFWTVSFKIETWSNG